MPTLEKVTEKENIFSRYKRRWKKQIEKLNSCIAEEKNKII